LGAVALNYLYIQEIDPSTLTLELHMAVVSPEFCCRTIILQVTKNIWDKQTTSNAFANRTFCLIFSLIDIIQQQAANLGREV
jgi:hypothetical protein